MNNTDDSITDMDDHDLTDEQIEQLIAGTGTPAGFEGVATEFAALRDLNAGAPRVAVYASLGEFVSTDTPTPETDDEIVLAPASSTMSSPAPRRQSMLAGLAGTTAAKFALAGGVALAGITGAHAAGLVDVPLLPDEGEPIEIISAGQTDGAAEALSTPADQPATADEPENAVDPDEAPDANQDQDSRGPAELDGTINIVVGDASFQITIDNSDGDLRIHVDVEGVSPGCEAAIEALEDLTDFDALDAAGDTVEQACADDFADFGPGFGELDFDADGVFGGVFGHSFGQCDLGLVPGEQPGDKSLDELLESCLPDGIEIFGDIGGFEHFQEQFGSDFGDLGQLDELLEGLDLSELEGLFEGQDFSQLDELFEGLDLDELEGLLEGQDFSEFEELFEGLDLGEFGGGEFGDFEGLIEQFLEDLNKSGE